MNHQHRIKSFGLTLVELVIALSVMAAIGGIAIHSLLIVFRQQKIMEEASSATDAAQWIDSNLESCIHNMVSSPMGDIQPFAESVSEDGTASYNFLTHIPDNYVVRSKTQKTTSARALLVSISSVPVGNDENTLELSYSTQPVGTTGLLDEPDVQVLARNLTQFTIQSQAGDSGEGESNLPKSFGAQFGFTLSDGNTLSWNQTYPVMVCPPKETDKEESE
ncbi:MAG: hypothetical protein ABFD69_10445 [Candidatus Sumerlaeia bacterium]